MPGAAGRLAARVQALAPWRRRALGVSLLWAVVVTAYAIGYLGVSAGGQGRGMVFLDGLLFLLALVLPVVLVWLVALVAEELARQREMIAALAEVTTPLFDALDATRAALGRHGPASPEAIRAAVREAVREGVAGAGRGPDLSAPLDRLAAGQSRLEASLAALRQAPAPIADCAPAVEPPAPQPGTAGPRDAPDPAPDPSPVSEADPLPLLPEAEAAARLSWPELIRALDFPRDAADRDGFRALKAALRHPALAQMLQAAEDVLTMLSQEGVYMEDLPAAKPDPAAWRRFIAGARGVGVSGLGGITHEHALAIGRGLLKSDPVFRDTSLFFQRRFDTVLSDYAAGAGDAELTELAGTRSGRAFMLLARLSGSLG